MTCKARVENLDDILGFTERCADQFGMDGKKKFGLLVAVEEAFVNVCNYAYTKDEGDVELFCGREGGSFLIEISDAGMEFNVLNLPEPDTTSSIEERQIGGLGIHFIRTMTDDFSYRREHGKNILRMVIHPQGAGAGDCPPQAG